MFIKREEIKVGDSVENVEVIYIDEGHFEVGHVFTIADIIYGIKTEVIVNIICNGINVFGDIREPRQKFKLYVPEPDNVACG